MHGCWLVVVCRSELTSLKPEAEALLKNESTGKIKGVIVTMKGAPTAQPGYDFYSRYFAPWLGVLEDPVCGELKWSHNSLNAATYNTCGEICRSFLMWM